MSVTFKWLDVYQRVAGAGPRVWQDNEIVYAVNEALNRLWFAYDWPFTLKTLTPFYLVPGYQNHAIPDSDFAGLRRAWIVETASGFIRRPMEIRNGAEIERTLSEGIPRMIGYDPSANALIVWPRVPSAAAATDYIVNGVYKKTPQKVEAASLATTSIPFDDRYFGLCCLALEWSLLPNSSEKKQMLTMMLESEMERVASAEGLNVGPTVGVAPAEPLARWMPL